MIFRRRFTKTCHYFKIFCLPLTHSFFPIHLALSHIIIIIFTSKITITMHKTLALLLTCLCAFSSEGFAPRSLTKTRSLSSSAKIALLQADNEDDATYLLHKAEECALSDSCSIDDARLFLREVIHLESGCAAGTLVGDDLCNDQQHVAEIVASLRAKVERGETTSLE